MKKLVILFVLINLAVLGCARSEWVSKKGALSEKMKRPFVVFKGPRDTRDFFTQLERASQKEMLKWDLRPNFMNLDHEPSQGEKSWTKEQCSRMRCDHIILLYMNEADEPGDSLEVAADKSKFYKLRARIVGAKSEKVDWEANLDLDPSEVEGTEFTNSIYAENVIKNLIEVWRKEGLVR